MADVVAGQETHRNLSLDVLQVPVRLFFSELLLHAALARNWHFSPPHPTAAFRLT
jgi:hypothetical protein